MRNGSARPATFGYQGQQLITITTPYTSSPQYPHTWTLAYDIFGRPNGITSPISGTQDQAGYTPHYTTAISYTPGMTQTQLIEGMGTSGALTHTYTLDAQGNAPQLTDVSGQGHTHTATYDANHDVLSSVDALGNTTLYTYTYVGPTGNIGLLTQEQQPSISDTTLNNGLACGYNLCLRSRHLRPAPRGHAQGRPDLRHLRRASCPQHNGRTDRVLPL